MFSFFKKKAVAESVAAVTPAPALEPAAARTPWLVRLRTGLRKTNSAIAQVFTGTRIDDALYEELEAALLMADAGVKATAFLLADLKQRVKAHQAADPAAVKAFYKYLLINLTCLFWVSEIIFEVGAY